MPGALKRSILLPMLVFAAALTAGCNQLAQQPSVAVGEQPELLPASGTLPVADPVPFVMVADRKELKNPFAEPTSTTVAAGKLEFERFCRHCHGEKLDGNSTVGPSFPDANLSLFVPKIAKMTDEEIFLATWLGTGKNPPFAGTMSPEEVWQVIAYVRSAQANPPPGANIEGFVPVATRGAPALRPK